MAITFVNKGTFTSGIGALSVPMPASITTNDLLLLFIESENQTHTIPNSGWSSGWFLLTELGTGTAGTDASSKLSIYYRIATSTNTAVTVSDAGDHTAAIVVAFRGTHTSFIDVTTSIVVNSTTTASKSFPAITTASDGDMIINVTSLNQDVASTAQVSAWTNASLVSITERHDQTVTSGGGGGIALATGIKTTAGSVDATTATFVTTEYSQNHIMATIALKPIVLPYVTRNPATNITTSTADVSINVTETGGGPTLTAGIQYGITTAYSSSLTLKSTPETGEASGTLTGLMQDTTYYYRAFGTNEAGTYLEGGGTFKTDAVVVPPPVLTIDTFSLSKISDEIGKNTCSVTFSTDRDILSWEARATNETQTPAQGVGVVVGSGGSVSAGGTGSFDVDYTELTDGDRVYTISVYQLS